MDQGTREVRDEVEEARERLGETVEALTYKMSAPKRLKGRAAVKFHELKARAGVAVSRIARRR
ncbi:MAG TPA: DUF3618 domain-containing protein [Gaiellales bacterium]|jgi:hypothetical protein|nr:DUF3618 domain-containing protein [Gaiellales bacterium]